MPNPRPETVEALLVALYPDTAHDTPSIEQGLRLELLSMALHDPSKPRTISDLLRVLLGHSWRGPVAHQLCATVRRRMVEDPDLPLEALERRGRRRA